MHIREPQATLLFQAIQVAERNTQQNENENEEEEESGAHEPIPSSSGEPYTAKEDDAGGELLEQAVSQSSPSASLNQSVETSSVVAVGTELPLQHSSMSTMSHLLALSAQPELELVLGVNGTSEAAAAADEEEQKKQRLEREHKKRSKNWTRPETTHLIRLRAQLESRFAKSGRKTELWDEIAEALQKQHITRDAQQCRDKWEKLTAGYKEVRDGLKDREDNPFYDQLHSLLSVKPMKRELRERDDYVLREYQDSAGRELTKDLSRHEVGRDAGACREKKDRYDGAGRPLEPGLSKYEDNEPEDGGDARAPARKKKRAQKYMAVTDVVAVQNALEIVITRQQKLFRDLLDSMERKEMIREQLRQEREDKWRTEERAQQGVFYNAMIALMQKLVGEKINIGAPPTAGLTATTTAPVMVGSPELGPQVGPKRRSKNWKRSEVLQLIKLRGDMEARFGKSTRHAVLWDEVAEVLVAQGIKRDGKQCREKWDKLMAEYKDVSGGKRDQTESHYFAELTNVLGRSAHEAG